MRELMEQLLATHTGKTREQVSEDVERDKILTASAALEYGIIDQVISTRSAGLAR
jgi:ATP-dependent Clp protease protease subunit